LVNKKSQVLLRKSELEGLMQRKIKAAAKKSAIFKQEQRKMGKIS
jgi:hypothetical protein